ncbi:MAG: hypothetical protein D6718_07615 [Acidobacteria bacterium]|nr:MAG: hypothetical protein D6718_07615 [Acidobacteriota bacterium]
MMLPVARCSGRGEVSMIAVGSEAPAFTLQDQFGRTIDSKKILETRHLMLLFYPLDFTPT